MSRDFNINFIDKNDAKMLTKIICNIKDEKIKVFLEI